MYGFDTTGQLVVLDIESGARLDSLYTGPLPVRLSNDQTDRIYFASETGLIQCLHELELSEPLLHNQMTPPQRPARQEAVQEGLPQQRPAEDRPAQPGAPEADPFGAAADPFAAPQGAPAPAGQEADPFGAPAQQAPADQEADPFGAPAQQAPADQEADPFGAPAQQAPADQEADPFGQN